MPKRKAATSDDDAPEGESKTVEVLDTDDDDDGGGDDEDRPDLQSPQADAWKDMSLRSGKKKRRRSRDTTGLTPPDRLERKRKSARLSSRTEVVVAAAVAAPAVDATAENEVRREDHDEDGDSRHGTENTDTIPRDAHAASEPVQPSSSSSSSSPDARPANRSASAAAAVVDNLRLPSQHTPGNLHETARLPKPTAPALAQPNDHHAQLRSTKRLLFNGSSDTEPHKADPATQQQQQQQQTQTQTQHRSRRQELHKYAQHQREIAQTVRDRNEPTDFAPSSSSTTNNAATVAAETTRVTTVKHKTTAKTARLDGDDNVPVPPEHSTRPHFQQATSNIQDSRSNKHRHADDNGDDSNDEDYYYVHQPDFEDDYSDVNENPVIRRLRKPSTWFVLVFVLQLVLGYFRLNPIMASVMTSTSILLNVYGKIWARPVSPSNPLLANATDDPAAHPSSTPPAIDPASCRKPSVHALVGRLQRHAVPLSNSQRTVAELRDEARRLHATLAQQLEDQERSLLEERQKLERIRESLQQALRADYMVEPSWAEARAVIREYDAPNWHLLDLLDVYLWDFADVPECDVSDEVDYEVVENEMDRDDEEDDLEENDDFDDTDNLTIDASIETETDASLPALTVDDLASPALVDRKVRELSLVARQTSSQIRRSQGIPEQIKAEVVETLRELGVLKAVEEARSMIVNSIDDVPEVVSLPAVPEGVFGSTEDVQQAVLSLINIERADRTGELDFASVVLGARVIRDGPHATSPSLVESLPLGNRVMALLGTKFYGYGPEAALVPTYPVHSIGQCWSFRPWAVSNKGNRGQQLEGSPDDAAAISQYNGRHATLSVRLARPVYVTSIILEHPPSVATGQPDSAIRKVRVIGYAADNATGRSWNLGSIEFDPRKGDLQQYNVSRTVAGVDVPMLSSVTLAIDSNWGSPYSCLYRFRVQGRTESAAVGSSSDS